MMYRITRVLTRLAFLLLFRLRAIGLENIPTEGAVIICCNHKSNLDPPILATPLDRKVHYMAKEELFKVPILGWLIKTYGAFPVKRGGVSKDAIRSALRILEDGHVLGIFPEGSRRSTGMAKKGAASFAIRSSATVIPAAIIGSYVPLRRMSVVYGKPLDLSAYADGSAANLEMVTEKIMEAIRELISQHER